ncbi:type I-F CRISPR-associated protein Csy3 [Piscirickettsia litoralis]|uniref:Type I-F CRISPR-associated protein Csy3 n=1 Tax=Piscirickettsia litoralis TaxID=1891921 RepID=A0ABX3A260_9GAMM|nr:type I-F CRISPR-associated protein Csy3 [Piscirickettsia litoralis]ODN42585.1 type I-F CRISPR-associated protein Csy3 [Piscirickettsia litoralis]
MSKKENIASVLVFEKKIVPSDALMYGTIWDKRRANEKNEEGLPKDESVALKIVEKSVRGTISNRLNKALAKDPTKLDAKVESPNIQKVDSCALGVGQDTLKLSFTVKFLSGVQTPSACNSQGFQSRYHEAAGNYIKTAQFNELALRYAANIANGRFLWRNRVGAECIEVHVEVLAGADKEKWIFNALDFDLQRFEDLSNEISALAEKIADTLSGKKDFLLLKIDAYSKLGEQQDVYPSEELVFDKSNSKEKKSKVLYDVDNIAAMHSQKIGNAIRTIDTWYPSYGDNRVGPIAVEPYGAVTNLGKAYRNPKDKVDFFTLFDKFVANTELPEKEMEHYVMAVLVRGGVFGASDKD